MKIFLISSVVAILIGVGGYFALTSLGTDSASVYSSAAVRL